jgi:hypothetical protein
VLGEPALSNDPDHHLRQLDGWQELLDPGLELSDAGQQVVTDIPGHDQTVTVEACRADTSFQQLGESASSAASSVPNWSRWACAALGRSTAAQYSVRSPTQVHLSRR